MKALIDHIYMKFWDHAGQKVLWQPLSDAYKGRPVDSNGRIMVLMTHILYMKTEEDFLPFEPKPITEPTK